MAPNIRSFLEGSDDGILLLGFLHSRTLPFLIGNPCVLQEAVVYACVWVCMYVCMYICTYVRTYVKSSPITGLDRPRGFREVKTPRFHDNGTGWWQVVSLTHRPPIPPGNAPGTHFCQRLSRPQGHSDRKDFMSMKNSTDTSWDRTSNLPICSTLTTVLPRSPMCVHTHIQTLPELRYVVTLRVFRFKSNFVQVGRECVYRVAQKNVYTLYSSISLEYDLNEISISG